MSTGTGQTVYLTTSDVTELFKNGTINKDGATFRISARCLRCGINNCQWEGTDNVDLSAHVRISHSESSPMTSNEPSQVVLTKLDLQEIVSQGVKAIREKNFTVVQCVRYLFDLGGGKWFTTGGNRLDDISCEQVAREADELKQLERASNEKTVQLAKKDEVIKAEQDAKNVFQIHIDELSKTLAKNDEIAKTEQDAKKALQCHIHELSKKLDDVNSKLQLATEVATQLQPDHNKDLSQCSETMIATSPVASQSANPVVANDKDTSNTSFDSATTSSTIDIEYRLKSKIKDLLNERSIKEPLVNDSVAIHKRFFVYAREGMINFREQTSQPYTRSPYTQDVMKCGNTVAHHANIRAHVSMYKLGQLNPNEIATFQKMYGFHPEKFDSMLVTEKMTSAWDLMGSVAGCLARVKFDLSGTPQYKEFLSRAEALSKIRASIDAQTGNTEKGRKLFDEIVDVNQIIAEMVRLGNVFDAKDKAERGC